MSADDQTGPSQWGAASLEHFEQLARGVLRAAREAERELRRTSPDPEQPTWALAVLAGQAQAMLGHDGPAHPPVGAAAQEEFVCTSVKLAVDALSHRWAEADLGLAGVAGQADAPHLGERETADAFDVLGRLMLPNSTPEGWTAAVLTDLARGDETWEAVVKVGKYILHPTFLAFADDATRVVGEAVHNLNVRHLRARAHLLRDHMGASKPCRPAAEPTLAVKEREPERNWMSGPTLLESPQKRRTFTPPARPPRKRTTGLPRTPCLELKDGNMASPGPVHTAPEEQPSPEPRHAPDSASPQLRD
ncbi:hypothetical protein [Streptomyces sp. R35]|uniref:Uncharacterized protein n=1 Tax=Streptomyces sp. R35 TaxID=3238630 RepID=A0AB39SIY8_9ACTN